MKQQERREIVIAIYSGGYPLAFKSVVYNLIETLRKLDLIGE